MVSLRTEYLSDSPKLIVLADELANTSFGFLYGSSDPDILGLTSPKSLEGAQLVPVSV